MDIILGTIEAFVLAGLFGIAHCVASGVLHFG